MKKIKLIWILCIFLFIPNPVLAHPGRTDSNGCHTCKSNCSSWGLEYGEYHCHNGNTYTNSKNQTFYKDGTLISDTTPPTPSNQPNIKPNTPEPPIIIKSNNANLGTLTVDNNNLNIEDTMNYTITNTNPIIEATPEDKKATVKINKPNEWIKGKNEITILVTAEDSTTKKYKLLLNIGNNDATLKILTVNAEEIEIQDEMNFETTENIVEIIGITTDYNATIIGNGEYQLETGIHTISIQVTAEDGITQKEYILKINKILSNNVGVTITINNQEVVFNDYQSNIIYFPYTTEEIEIKYELEDERSSINLQYDKKIPEGRSKICFKVIAENGKEQEYTLNLFRYGKIEDTPSSDNSDNNETSSSNLIPLIAIGGSYYAYRKWKKNHTK